MEVIERESNRLGLTISSDPWLSNIRVRLIVDEGTGVSDPRFSMASDNIMLSQFFMEIRKYGISPVWIVQHSDNIDKRNRQLCAEIYKMFNHTSPKNGSSWYHIAKGCFVSDTETKLTPWKAVPELKVLTTFCIRHMNL